MDAKEKLRALALVQFIPARNLIREGQELEPMLCFESDLDRKSGIAAIPQYGDPEKKGLAIMAMSQMLKEMGAERYTFTMEAWTGEVKRSEYVPGYLPSEDPGRKEAIVVSAADNQGNKLVMKCTIIRGETVTFSEPETVNVFSGPLLELLDDKPTVN